VSGGCDYSRVTSRATGVRAEFVIVVCLPEPDRERPCSLLRRVLLAGGDADHRSITRSAARPSAEIVTASRPVSKKPKSRRPLQRALVGAPAFVHALASPHQQTRSMEPAADIRRVLRRREPETRRVLQAVISEPWWPQRDSNPVFESRVLLHYRFRHVRRCLVRRSSARLKRAAKDRGDRGR